MPSNYCVKSFRKIENKINKIKLQLSQFLAN